MPSPIVVSFSELDAARQCPHKHYLAYRQRWSLPAGRALATGKLWHAVMAAHYLALQAGASTLSRRRAIAELLLEAAGDDGDRADLVAWMFDGYEERWETDSQWEILGVEDQRLVRLPAPPNHHPSIMMRMRVDLLVREKQATLAGAHHIWVVDHKTSRDLPTQKELDLDDQFGLYTFGLRQLGIPVFGQVYSAARTYRHREDRPPTERFDRIRMHRNDRELAMVAQEAYITAEVAYSYGQEGREAPRATDSDRCRWRCPFTEPCLLGRKAGPDAEQEYLQALGRQVSEEEQLLERGYRLEGGVEGEAGQPDRTARQAREGTR